MAWSASAPIIDALVRTGFNGKIIGLEYWESRPAYQKLLALDNILAYHVTHYRPDVLPSKFVVPFVKTNKRSPSALAAIGYEAAKTIGGVYSGAKSSRTPPILENLKRAKEIKGMLSYLRMGWDKSFERAMTISSPIRVCVLHSIRSSSNASTSRLK